MFRREVRNLQVFLNYCETVAERFLTEPVEEAFRRLVDAAGTQFDPRVVEVCLGVLKKPPPAEL